MRRLLVATTAALAVGLGGLVAAPAASAAACQNAAYQPAACPTPVGTAATPSVTIRFVEGSEAVTLKATFNDPATSVRDVQFTVTGPGEPTARTVYTELGVPPLRNGAMVTYTAIYKAYNFKRPGRYTVTASAQIFGGGSAATTTTVASFVVKHESSLRMYASKSYVRLAQKVYFYGYLYPDNGQRAGQQVGLAFKAKGTKKFKSVAKTKVKVDGKYRFKQVKMVKQGIWRVTYNGNAYVLKSKAAMTFKIRRR